jgi:hypothetical protein
MKLAPLIRPKLNESNVTNTFNDVLKYLRTKVYPKLNDDDLYDLNIMIGDYFKKNV